MEDQRPTLPIELLSVFFEVIDDLSLFGKLSILSKEAYRYSQLHKKSFADRISRDGHLPNGVKHGIVEEYSWDTIEETVISERWEYGKMIMKLREVTEDFECPPDYSTDFEVYNPEGKLVYHLCDTRNGGDPGSNYTEIIGKERRTGYAQAGYGEWRFKQSYELAIQPMRF